MKQGISLKIGIDPLSVNKCWQGKRFKTPLYKQWREVAYYLLLNSGPKVEGWYGVETIFHVKNFKMVDVDNFEKPFFDALVESGLVKDDRYMRWHRSEKVPLERGEKEYIEFRIIPDHE